MKSFVRTWLPTIAWCLGTAVVAIAVIAWGSAFGWDFGNLDAYGLFPLFGLLAFSLMWTHYIILALRVYADAPKVELYTSLTQWLVLFCLLVHPGILLFTLYQEGFGLPPGSYKAYVGESMVGFVLLGTVAWCAFMAYELKRVIAIGPWWKYVLAASAIAMLLILIHSLNLGTHLQSGWLQTVWYVYGATLLLSYAYLIARGRLVSN